MAGGERSLEPPARRDAARAALHAVGVTTATHAGSGRRGAAFLGSLVVAAGGILRHPRTLPWRELPRLLTRTGAEAVPVVSAFLFCTGFVLAFQLTLQLERFGAGQRLPGLMTLALVRELGPLMTAFVIAGRSGATIAAELGALDRDPPPESDDPRSAADLVWPRILALAVALPLLVVVGSAAAIAGGALFATWELGISPLEVVDDGVASLDLGHLLEGLGKTLAFAVAIGLIACYRGLAVRAGRQDIAAGTCGGVVLGLVAVIALDAGINVLLWLLVS